ncbi:MAG: nuclear transport factor 2 family protein [Planctomycetota bacterium]
MTPKEHALAWFENVWNQKREDYIRQYLRLEHDAPEEISGIGPPKEGDAAAKAIQSVDQFIAFWKAILKAIDPLRIDVRHVIESGDAACGIADILGTDQRTGTEVCFQLGFWVRIQDDVIVEAENVVDFHRYLVQLDPEHEAILSDHFGGEA